MAGGCSPREAQPASVPDTEMGEMRPFKRKIRGNVARRCASCGEPLPSGAHACAMCGAGFGMADLDAREREVENASPDDTRRRRRLGNGAGLA